MLLNLKLTILPPIGENLTRDADMILIPAIDGQIGILKGHIPLITSLQFGLIVLFDSQKLKLDSFYISGGQAEVKDDNVKIICDNFISIKECNKSFLEKKIVHLNNPRQSNFYQNIINILYKLGNA